MRKLINTFAICVFFLIFTLSALAAETEVYIDGTRVEYSENTGYPIRENGTVLLPLYPTFEAFGAEIVQDNPHGTVTVIKDAVYVSCNTAEKMLYRNGTKIPSEYGLVWRGGPLYVHAGLFSALDCEVYVGKESVVITSPSRQPYENFDVQSSSFGSVGVFAASCDESYRGARYFGARYEPKNGIYLGAEYSENSTKLAEFADKLPKGPSAYKINAGTSLPNSDLLYLLRSFGAEGRSVYYTITPKSIRELCDTGEATEQYTELAKALEATGAKIFLGFAQNPNCVSSPFYGADVEDYISSFTAVSDIFRKHAPSVAQVWSHCVCCRDGTDFYPGDNAADYVGLSFCENGGSASALSLIDDSAARYGYKKPFLITSSPLSYIENSNNGNEAAAREILEFYSYLPVKFPQVKAAFLLEDSILSCSPEVGNAVRAGIFQNSYIGFGEGTEEAAYHFQLGSGVTVPPSEITLVCHADMGETQAARVVFALNGKTSEELYGDALPFAVNADFSEYAGRSVLLEVSVFDGTNRLCAQNVYAINVSGNSSADNSVRTSAPDVSAAGLCAALAVIAVGIIVVSRKIKYIF